MAGELNFGILDTNAPAKAASSIFAGQQAAQANDLAQAQLQHAQSQNELSKYTLASAKRTDEQQNALNAIVQQGFDPANPEHVKKLYSFGPAGQALAKTIQETQGKAVETQGRQLDNAKKKQEAMAQAHRDISGNPSDAQITAHLEDTLANPLFTDAEKAKIQADAQALLAMPYEARKQQLASQGATAKDTMEAQASKPVEKTDGQRTWTVEGNPRLPNFGQPIGAAPIQQLATPGQQLTAETAKAGHAVQMRGQNMTAETARAGQQISRGQLEVAQGGLKLRQEGLTELPPKEVQKREAKYPAATAAVKEATAANEQLVKDLEALKVHKGLDGITGVVYGRTPSVTEASREAKAKLDKILARGGFSELAKMRAASPTGGALGNISDTEGKYLRSAFAAMDPVQSKESFQKAIDDAITELKGSNARIQDAYDMTYEYKAPRAAGAPAAEALSPAEQVELDALRKRFNK